MSGKGDHQATHVKKEILVEEYLLRRAALDRAESEQRVSEAVEEALSGGVSWDRIGQLLGMSRTAAQEQYAELRHAS